VDNAKSQSITFAITEDENLTDISHRNAIKTKSMKGMKFPKNLFDGRLIKHVYYGKVKHIYLKNTALFNIIDNY
jgi:hypothetical protein